MLIYIAKEVIAMLIIEGLDGSGKTTLINQLLTKDKKLLKPENINNSFEKYHVLLKETSPNSLMDRSFISEMVYGKVLSNKTKLTEEEYQQLLKLYSKSKSIVIYLYAPKEVLLNRRINDKKDKLVLLKFYEKLLNEFDYRLSEANIYLPTYKINTYKNSQEEVLSKVKQLTKF